MAEKRRGGFIFRTFKGDHPPYHVHIRDKKGELGRWDIENQKAMDDFKVTKKLRRVLEDLGYAGR